MEFKASDELHCSSSYVNNEGEHPAIGTCIRPNNIALDEKIINEKWKFCLEDEDLRGQMRYLKYCEDEYIIITHE